MGCQIKLVKSLSQNNGEPTLLLVHCLYQMSTYNHKRTTSSLIYVAINSAIKRKKVPPLITLRSRCSRDRDWRRMRWRLSIKILWDARELLFCLGEELSTLLLWWQCLRLSIMNIFNTYYSPLNWITGNRISRYCNHTLLVPLYLNSSQTTRLIESLG